jgi:hypothetical protein
MAPMKYLECIRKWWWNSFRLHANCELFESHEKKKRILMSNKIEDPADPSGRRSAETTEYAQFKREVYQMILSQIFASL